MKLWALYTFDGGDDKILATFDSFELAERRKQLKAESEKVLMLNIRMLEDVS